MGAGRIGTALGVLLERGGFHVVAVAGRRPSYERAQRYLPFATFAEPAEAAKLADIVILSVPDDLVEPGADAMARAGAFRSGQVVAHTSGFVGLDALAAAEAAGAEVLALHPLQTVPEVSDGIERLPGSAVAVTARTDTAYEAGERLAKAIGAVPFRLSEGAKPLYHAAAVFCSNYLVVVEGIAEELFAEAGVENPLEVMAPLARAAFDSMIEHGPAAALTGPAARGDAGTVTRTLEALRGYAPGAARAYATLALEAARLAERGGTLSDEARRRLEGALEEWR